MDNETKEKAAALAGEAKKKATGIWSKCAGKIATLWKSGVKGKVICIVGAAVILLVLRCCISGDERRDDPAKAETVEKAQPSRVDNAKTPAVPGSINFFGFYTGMPQSEATALAAHYGVEVGEKRSRRILKRTRCMSSNSVWMTFGVSRKGPTRLKNWLSPSPNS